MRVKVPITADYIWIGKDNLPPATVLIIFIMSRSILVLLALLTLSCLSADCPVGSKSQLVSDSVSLTSQTNSNTTAQKLVFNYPFDSSFSSSPSIAIGINEIQASQAPYLEIQIQPSRITPERVYFQAKSSEQSIWKSFQINFLASSRDDLEIGTAFVNQPLTNREGSFELNYAVKNDFTTSAFKVKSFLSGISVQAVNKQDLAFTQSAPNIQGRLIYFTFSSVERKSIIHSVSLSIVVFNINTPGVLYADGIIDQNYVTSTTAITIPKHGINELRTYIVGLNSFSTTTAAPISISSAIDETFKLVIGPIDRTQIDFISVSYLILSIVDCGSCNGYPLLFDGLCRLSCPDGYKEENGRCVPIICKDGFKPDGNGWCIPVCGENQHYYINTCVCHDGYYLINNVCVACPPGTYFNFRESACKPLCTGNSYYSNGRCFCNPGFYIINNFCQQCPYGSRYNQITQKCDNICTSPYEVYSPDGCVCKNGYFKIDGFCGRCPYRKVYNPATGLCDCPAGQELVGNMCMPICGNNEIRAANGDCVCRVGFNRLFSGDCIVCPPNSVFNGLTLDCDCVLPYMKMNGTCTPICRSNQYFDPATRTCVPHCAQYLEEWIGGKCVCTHGYERAENGTCVYICGPYSTRVNGVCTCIAGYTRDLYGRCIFINCPPGSSWNPTLQDCVSSCRPFQIFINGGCVCLAGYTNDNTYGDCIPDCRQNEVRINGFCQCGPNFMRVDSGICIPNCPSGVYDQWGNCDCKRGCGSGIVNYCAFGQTYDPVTASCRCDRPKVWVLGQCQYPNLCGPNEYWCGTACICNYGFFKVNGTCTEVPAIPQCPENSVSNGIFCACVPGTYPISGGCRPCPADTVWNGRRCDAGGNCEPGFYFNVTLRACLPIETACGPNEKWDGRICICKHGYFLIDGVCTTCPYGTVFDGHTCVPGGNIPTCIDPFSFYNGKTCVCLPNYWPLLNGACVSCPDGTYWAGNCCLTRSGNLPVFVMP